MTSKRASLRETRSWRFDLGVCVLGLLLLVWSLPVAWDGGWRVALAALVGAPLVVLVARFPMVLDNEDGGIEIGFDSIVLVYLMCTFDPLEALAVWGLGVLGTQSISGKRAASLLFNLGVGILAGGAAVGTFHVLDGGSTGTPRELAAVVAAATAYFFVDYVVSAISVAIDSHTPVRRHLVQAGTWVAVACFVPFDLLGYLAVVVLRSNPWWTLVLLVVPLATLLINTRAIVHARENSRRLSVLFEAAVRVQALHETGHVVDALLVDARRLIRLRDVDVRSSPPLTHEIGAQIRRGKDALWVVAPARDRARSTVGADQHALDALAVICSEAFARLQLTDEMVHYARHDPLTDLPNRGILLDRAAQALHRARRRGVRVALLFIDLDTFKPVNDRYGHAAGDAVLVDVARRLMENVRDEDTVARLGGDEFAVLLEDVAVGEVVEISDRILGSLAAGTDVAGHRVNLAASIGIAYGDGSESADALLRHADLAMYEAKGRGKAQYVAYEPEIGQARMRRLELVDELRAAIANRDLRVVYQPVVSAATGRIAGAEALVRWRLGENDVRTDMFVRLAEETEQVGALGELVLEIVAQDAAALEAVAGGPISLSVNVSARQLQDPGFVTAVERAVRSMGGVALVLEITERQEITDGSALEAMHTIAQMGVRFAMDDFGVGFSSISYLRDLPVDVVKTDAALSQHIDDDERARAVLRAVSVMAEALGLDVIVEGIEREGQLAAVREQVGAPYVQGFLLHRPMPIADLLSAVHANRFGDQPPAEQLTPVAL
ncbi:putative bifunctional diguanylate cyclase/phosphodiesterase [Nocardioides halotolerans]|uniref:putative bifunctional diguanylate cyclase/phosphodiesterase n=1 Tax=Nocardioides halotolerans TaxID=433660 RepID=UPI00042327E2|nr:EAL domain-containing protein [Nocardioides halotolerans]